MCSSWELFNQRNATMSNPAEILQQRNTGKSRGVRWVIPSLCQLLLWVKTFILTTMLQENLILTNLLMYLFILLGLVDTSICLLVWYKNHFDIQLSAFDECFQPCICWRFIPFKYCLVIFASQLVHITCLALPQNIFIPPWKGTRWWNWGVKCSA